MLNQEQLNKSKEIAKSIEPDRLENHEFLTMGRQVVHDHPYFTKLQIEFCDMVSSLAGEAVEPMYNFLSLYNNLGVCQPHMDAPLAKWTLDVCTDQSEPWPIYFSQIKPWPKAGQYKGDDWQQQILDDEDNDFFDEQVLYPGEGLLFWGVVNGITRGTN